MLKQDYYNDFLVRRDAFYDFKGKKLTGEVLDDDVKVNYEKIQTVDGVKYPVLAKI